MPFTLSHAAAGLPLRRIKYLSTVPLLLGTFMPDVPQYLPVRLQQLVLDDTHSFSGLFTVSLPLGMAMLLTILLLQEPLTALLSERARWVCLQALERFAGLRRRWLVAAISILVGAWTHIAWDSFTHPDGWTATRVAALNAPLDLFGWHTQLSHVLQYVSSVFGLAVLAWWYPRLAASAPVAVRSDPNRGRLRVLLVLVFCAAMLIGGMQAVREAYEVHVSSFYYMTDLVLTHTLSWFALLYIVAGLLVGRSRRVVAQPAVKP
ncbi:MAG TPA: DUF4184 family protein [Steroidobacteraceae bacterium]|nr:DUF4184 family protein [Steroidobacteraceae bacterium]